MTEKTPSTTTIPSRRVLCSEGQRLHNLWDDAMMTHDLDQIYSAMKAYFIHVNGSSRLDACTNCGRFEAPYGKNI